MEQTLNKDFFIKKFMAIPDDKWIANGDMQDTEDTTKGCALFHLGVNWDDTSKSDDTQADALGDLLRSNLKKISVTHPIAKILIEKESDYDIKGIIENNESIIYLFNDGSSKYNLHPKQSLLMALEAI